MIVKRLAVLLLLLPALALPSSAGADSGESARAANGASVRLTLDEARRETRLAIHRHARERHWGPITWFKIPRCTRRSPVRVGCRFQLEFLDPSTYTYFCYGGARVIEDTSGYDIWHWGKCFAESE
jgi:hypothetical protein